MPSERMKQKFERYNRKIEKYQKKKIGKSFITAEQSTSISDLPSTCTGTPDMPNMTPEQIKQGWCAKGWAKAKQGNTYSRSGFAGGTIVANPKILWGNTKTSSTPPRDVTSFAGNPGAGGCPCQPCMKGYAGGGSIAQMYNVAGKPTVQRIGTMPCVKCPPNYVAPEPGMAKCQWGTPPSHPGAPASGCKGTPGMPPAPPGSPPGWCAPGWSKAVQGGTAGGSGIIDDKELGKTLWAKAGATSLTTANGGGGCPCQPCAVGYAGGGFTSKSVTQSRAKYRFPKTTNYIGTKPCVLCSSISPNAVVPNTTGNEFCQDFVWRGIGVQGAPIEDGPSPSP